MAGLYYTSIQLKEKTLMILMLPDDTEQFIKAVIIPMNDIDSSRDDCIT
jgi:hypothetical protein